MKQELEDKLTARWPAWFNSSLRFGFAHGDGWFELIWQLCQDLEILLAGQPFCILQVKEKFGGLRFYTGVTTAAVLDRITLSEAQSFEVCELCGQPGVLCHRGGWRKTLCQSCCSNQYYIYPVASQ